MKKIRSCRLTLAWWECFEDDPRGNGSFYFPDPRLASLDSTVHLLLENLEFRLDLLLIVNRLLKSGLLTSVAL